MAPSTITNTKNTGRKDAMIRVRVRACVRQALAHVTDIRERVLNAPINNIWRIFFSYLHKGQAW